MALYPYVNKVSRRDLIAADRPRIRIAGDTTLPVSHRLTPSAAPPGKHLEAPVALAGSML